MTPSSEKKAWATPNVERFGSLAEVTQQNAKLLGPFDGDPFEDCPRGQYPCDGVSVS